MKKLILWLALLLPFIANAQVNGTIQKTASSGTIRGSFGSLGIDTIPRVTGTLVDGYILKYNASTNKWYASPDPTLVGLQDSLTKKANRTFDNVASGAIANAKLANSTISGVSLGSNLNTLTLGNGLTGTSYNGSSAVTARVDTTAIQTVANFFPKGDTRWAKSVTVQDSLNTRVKKSGDTMTGTLNGTSIVMSGAVTGASYGFPTGITLATNSGGINYLYSDTSGFNVTKNNGSTNLLAIDNTSGNAVHLGTVTAPAFIGNLTGNASTVTTNANLTGPITSIGNATSVASQTGTGSTFVMQASPTLTTPSITGPVTLTGNATSASRFIITGTDGNGASLFLNSLSTNGRNWGLYSNGIDAVGEFALYNATNGVTAFKFLPTGAVTFPILGGSGDVITAADNTGLLSKVTIGSGLSLTAGVLTATGGSSGSVTTSGGTAGMITKFTSASNVENSGLTESSGNLSTSGSMTASSFSGAGTGLTGTGTSFTAGAAQLVTIANDNSTNATYYPTWVTSTSGNQGPTTSSTKLTFNPSTGMLSATGFTGTLTGNASSAGLVTIANDNSTNATVYPLWATSVSGNQGPTASSTKLTFNPSTGVLTSSNLSGTNTGDQTTITGNAGTATALQTARNIQGVSFNGTADINPINGTGFVKAIGTTLSYDNSTYLTTSSASSTYAPLASPALTGNPTAPTQTAGDNSTKIATTAYADGIGSTVLAAQKQIANIYTNTSTTGTTTETLFTSNIAQSNLSADGDRIDFNFAGSFGLNANDKFVYLLIGGNTIAVSGNASNKSFWECEGYLMRTSSTTFRLFIRKAVDYVYSSAIADYTVTDFNPLTFSVLGQTNNASFPVTVQMGYLQSKKAP